MKKKANLAFSQSVTFAIHHPFLWWNGKRTYLLFCVIIILQGHMCPGVIREGQVASDRMICINSTQNTAASHRQMYT